MPWTVLRAVQADEIMVSVSEVVALGRADLDYGPFAAIWHPLNGLGRRPESHCHFASLAPGAVHRARATEFRILAAR